MRKLFNLEDSLSNKISFYHIIVFVISLPFDRFYSEIILCSFAAHTVFHIRKSHLQNFPVRAVLLVQSIFLLTLVATVHTVSLPQAFKEWEKQLAIFLFPLLLAVTTLDLRKYRNAFLLALAITCTLTIGYLDIS